MTIQLNGDTYTTKGSSTINELLTELSIQPERVAVEVNLKLIKKNEYPAFSFKEGDSIEIVSFVGGG